MVRMVLLLSMLMFSCFECVASDEAPEIWGGLAAGPHKVGFHFSVETDAARPAIHVSGSDSGMGSKTSRKVRMYIWYPVGYLDGEPMRFGDYAKHAAGDFGAPSAKNEDGVAMDPAIPLSRGFSDEGLARLLESPVAAVRDAPPQKGTFPCLVFGQGLYYESPITHALLCEYLASHGYAVVTCPLVGPRSRLVNLDNAGLDAQVRDMEFVLSKARELPFVDVDRLGVMGFDMGGMAGLVLVMRNPGVKAFVSLDAGILFGHPSQLPGSMPDYDVNHFRVPWIHFTRARAIHANRGMLNTESLFAKARFVDRYLIGVEGAQHVNFNSYSLLDIEKPVMSYWGPLLPASKKIYAAICDYTLNFLNGYLKGDEEGLAFIDRPVEEDEERGFSFFMEKAKAEPLIPTVDDFVNALYDQGAQEAVGLVRKAKENGNGKDPFSELFLNGIGYKCLYFWGKADCAIPIFEVMVEFYPESANAHDSLGEAYLLNGLFEEAGRSYRKSLELNPENDNALFKLEEINEQSDRSSDLGTPIRVKAGEEPVDGVSGHTAPFIADMNNDGLFDLLVGDFSGVCQIYLNEGSESNPKLKAGEPFQAGGKDGSVPTG